jgi:putative phosphonate catabolism associated alcohol dehydrogenase
MKTAWAMVFVGPGKPLEMREYPVPDPEPGALLVETSIATICGSDIHTATGRRGGDIPGILGHEITGRIIKLGSRSMTDIAGQPLQENDRVTWSIAAGCGECVFCKKWKLPQKCVKLFKYGHASCAEWPYFNGGFADVVYIRPGTAVLRVPDDLDDRLIVPINCALSTVMHGVEKMALHEGDTAVIQGAGMLGIYAAAVLRNHGCAKVFIIDQDIRRLKVAEKFGGTPLLLGEYGNAGIKDIVMQNTGGFGADAVLEVCGVPESIPAGVDMLRTGGHYVTAGVVFPDARFELDGYRIITGMITLAGIHNYRPDHLLKALDFVNETAHEYPFEELITAEFPLDDINEALTAAQDRKNIRVAIC